MNKILLVASVLTLGLGFTSCQKEFELNSELNPVAKIDLSSPRVYVKVGDLDNTTTVDQKTIEEVAGTIDATYNTEFYAYLSKPAEQDVVVTASFDTSSSALQTAKKTLGDDDLVALDAEALKLKTATVTIKKGQTKSETPFAISSGDKYVEIFQNQSSGTTSAASLSFAVEGATVPVSQNYGTIVLPFEKVSILQAQATEFSGYNKVTDATYTVSSFREGFGEANLHDGNVRTYWYSQTEVNANVVVELNEVSDLNGVYIYTSTFNNNTPTLEVSQDGVTWESLGTIVSSTGRALNRGVYVPFGKTVKAKYVQFTPMATDNRRTVTLWEFYVSRAN